MSAVGGKANVTMSAFDPKRTLVAERRQYALPDAAQHKDQQYDYRRSQSSHSLSSCFKRLDRRRSDKIVARH